MFSPYGFGGYGGYGPQAYGGYSQGMFAPPQSYAAFQPTAQQPTTQTDPPQWDPMMQFNFQQGLPRFGANGMATPLGDTTDGSNPVPGMPRYGPPGMQLQNGSLGNGLSIRDMFSRGPMMQGQQGGMQGGMPGAIGYGMRGGMGYGRPMWGGGGWGRGMFGQQPNYLSQGPQPGGGVPTPAPTPSPYTPPPAPTPMPTPAPTPAPFTPPPTDPGSSFSGAWANSTPGQMAYNTAIYFDPRAAASKPADQTMMWNPASGQWEKPR